MDQAGDRGSGGFGQLDWDITDNLTLTLGGRYTKDEKDFCQVFTGAPGEGQAAAVTDYDGLAKVPLFAHGDESVCPDWSRGVINNNFFDPVTNQDAVFNGSQSWSDFTPKIGLTYNMSGVSCTRAIRRVFDPVATMAGPVPLLTQGPTSLKTSRV